MTASLQHNWWIRNLHRYDNPPLEYDWVQNPSTHRMPSWLLTTNMVAKNIRLFMIIIARPKGVTPKAARPKDGLFRLHASWISPMQDLTVWPPSCVISENSRSLAAIFLSNGNTRHCSRVYISRDLIWIKIVDGKTIYKQIVIILAIRFAVLSTVFQWK